MTFLLKNTKTCAKANKVEDFEVASFLPTILYSVWLEIIGLHLVYVNIYYFPPEILFRLYLPILKIDKNYSFFSCQNFNETIRKVKVIFFVKNHSSNFLHCVVFILFLLVGIWETNMYEITNRMYHKKLSRYCTLQFPKGHSVRMACYWRRFCPVI